MSLRMEEITVLHVDDQPNFSDVLAEFLVREDERFSVTHASSASDALEHLEDAGFDCIVSDYDMHGLNGIEFLEAVREDDPDQPFLLYTGKGSEEVASEAISAGVTDYIQKARGVNHYSLLANRIKNAVEQVSASRRAEEEHRMNTVARRINAALVRATTEAEIDDHVCTILSEAEPYRFAWIGSHDPESQTIEPRSAAGIEGGYLDRIEITTDDSRTSRGPTAKAVREGGLAVVQNIPDESGYEPWRTDALERGFKSSAAIPLEYGESMYGVLNVYADHTHAFDEHERRLLSNLGETIAHAYHRIDLQRQYTDQYRILFEEAPVMVVFTTSTEQGPIIEDCNEAFADRIGYTREEIQETPLTEYYTDASIEQLFEERGYQRALTGDFNREQRTLVTRDGEELLTIVRATPRRNTDGEIVGTLALFLDITDQQQIQELERMTDLFEKAQQIANVGAWETDLRNEEGWWTQQINRIYGLPLGYEPEPGDGIEYFHPEDRPIIREAFERAKTAGESYDLELRVTSDDRMTKWVRVRGEPQIEDDDVVRIRGTLQDVTDRKEREEELKRTNALQSTLFDTLPQGILAEDESRNLLAVNQKMFDLLNLPGGPSDVVGEDCERLATMVSELFVDPDRFIGRISDLVSKDEPVDDEELTLADGRTLERSYRPIDLSDDGGHLWVYRDVTTRRERQRELETVLERMNDAAFVHREDGSFMFVNQTAVERYGYEEAELFEMTPRDIDVPEDAENVSERVRRILEEGELVFETEHQLASGRSLPVEVSSTTITFRGEPAVLSIVRDITNRKERERELHRQIDRLDEFASVVSHDLRNPLNVAAGRLELARDECECDHLDAAANGIERSLSLIDDMLTLARAGEQMSDVESVDVSHLVHACWEHVDSASASIASDLDLTVRADRSRLRQLMENLFRNSVDHGGENVTVTVGELVDGFYVEDDGPGIPEDEYDVVFDPGYSTRADGTGFGLPIVKQIVEAHEWQIRPTEGSNGGVRFEITGVTSVDE